MFHHYCFVHIQYMLDIPVIGLGGPWGYKMSRLPHFLDNPSSLTMALGLTQPLAEMSTRNLPWSKGWPAPKADNLTADCLENGSLDVSQPFGPPWPVTGIALPFTFTVYVKSDCRLFHITDMPKPKVVSRLVLIMCYSSHSSAKP
jgi:hypothetical protein